MTAEIFQIKYRHRPNIKKKKNLRIPQGKNICGKYFLGYKIALLRVF
jgi:hypothetical protein